MQPHVCQVFLSNANNLEKVPDGQMNCHLEKEGPLPSASLNFAKPNSYNKIIIQLYICIELRLKPLITLRDMALDGQTYAHRHLHTYARTD